MPCSHFDDASRRGAPIVVMHLLNPGASGLGGLETVVHALACGHALTGERVCVVATSDGSAARAYLERFNDTGVDVHALPDCGRAYRRERSAARGAFERLRPDVVHTHGYRPDVLDAGVARAMGIPTVTTIHGFTGSSLRNRIYAQLQRRSLRRFEAVVAVSSPMVRSLAAFVDAKRLHLIRNAYAATDPASRVDARLKLGYDNTTYVIGWVGRLSPEKGADLALAAVARVARTAPRRPLRIAILGEGSERPRLERLVRRLGIEALVDWHGPQPDAAALMPAFDVFMLSSRTEGTPMVLLEAMAAAVPMVATRVGGVPAMLSADAALLVPGNDPQALAGGILAVMADPEMARQRAARATELLARQFAPHRWLRRYASLYRDLHAAAHGVAPC